MTVIRKVSPKKTIQKPEEKIEKSSEETRIDARTDNRTETRRTRKCNFCQSKTEPHYYDISSLRKYLTDRGRIMQRGRLGNCAKHQRRTSQEIKRARHLALLPFTVRV